MPAPNHWKVPARLTGWTSQPRSMSTSRWVGVSRRGATRQWPHILSMWSPRTTVAMYVTEPDAWQSALMLGLMAMSRWLV